jgi:hypothetical protein
MTAPLVESLKLKIKGVAPLVRLAGLIVLGMELQRLKRELGYEGEGGWQAFRAEQKSGNRPRWTEFCIEQAGITEVMASHYHHCGEAVRFRLRFSSKPGAKDLLWAMEFKPSEMSEKERSSLIERIEKIGLTRGDTQVYLRKEYKAAELPKEVEAGKRIAANPWPAVSPEDDHQKLLRVASVMKEEVSRRNAELGRLALRALGMMQKQQKQGRHLL